MTTIRLLILVVLAVPARAALTVTFAAGAGGLASDRLDGAVVYLRPAAGQRPALLSVPAASYEMSQQNRQFNPYIKVVPQGAQVSFPNRDRVAHHVYSFSPAKPFELPLYKGGASQPPGVSMDRAGVVTLGCNVHDWMIGYIYVADTPYFAQVAGLRAEIMGVPPGKYTLGVWHPGLDPRETVALPVVFAAPAQTLEVTLRYRVRALPQPTAPDEQFDEVEVY